MNEFIEALAPFAIKHGTAANVLPSLIIAQGILETGGGKSELAVQARNLFGIKKGSGWDGEVHAVVTSEYRKDANGDDELYYITAEFRKYESFEGSVIDLCVKYMHGVPGESRNRYEAVLGNFVFEDVAHAVRNAGYATDPNYPAKLINIFNMYDLGRFDEGIKIEEETTMRVVIDAGHGINTPGKRTPVGEREWSFNNIVALACIAELQKYSGVEILRIDDPSGRTDVSLANRTTRANSWKGSVLVSIHHNANTGSWGTWTGVETYVMTPATANPSSMRLAQQVHPRVVAAMGLRDRGIKAANFHMLRLSNMPAVLTEGGYMDSSIDIVKMRNQAVLRAQGIGIAQGIAAYGNLRLKPSVVTPVSNQNLFRVRKSWADSGSQLGAYSVMATAIDIAKANSGYKVYDHSGKLMYPVAIVAPTPSAPASLFRVRKSWADSGSQIGAFAELDTAVTLADSRRNEGFFVYDEDGRLVHNPVKYSSTVADRLGEAEIINDTPYLAFDNANSHVFRTLQKGHGAGGGMHYFEEKGPFTRVGIGWVATKDLAIIKNYASQEIVDGFVEKAAKEGITPNTEANKARLRAEVTRLL